MPITEPVLNEVDRDSAAWKKIKAHSEKRIDLLRRLNDDPKKDAIATARLRGRIKELENLMALDSPAPSMERDNSD